MSPSVQFGFKAIKPITAWHDEREVTFQPGDEVPANEWKGGAVEALIENGKLMRYATNVYAPGEVGGDSMTETTPASHLPDDRDALLARISDLEQLVALLTARMGGAERAVHAEEADGEFPRSLGGGSYELSDGSHVKGKAKAEAVQSELDAAVGAV